MTQKEKELLLQDLCARLPYDVFVHIRYKEGEPCYGKLTPRDIQWFIDSKIEVIKPYLRPMSSMTEEETEEYWTKINNNAPEMPLDEIPSIENIAKCSEIVLNWLNAHYFDYRGLIEKGLAIEATEGMYKII